MKGADLRRDSRSIRRNPKKGEVLQVRSEAKRRDPRSIWGVDLERKHRRKETGGEEFIGERKGNSEKRKSAFFDVEEKRGKI